jgi:hypothetical protein
MMAMATGATWLHARDGYGRTLSTRRSQDCLQSVPTGVRAIIKDMISPFLRARIVKHRYTAAVPATER